VCDQCQSPVVLTLGINQYRLWVVPSAGRADVENFTPLGIRSQTVQSLASRYTGSGSRLSEMRRVFYLAKLKENTTWKT
jgi:hypothetical protein